MRRFLCAMFLLAALPLSAEMKVLALAGSTRSESYNKKLLQEAVQIAKDEGATVLVVDLRDFPMPFYDGDLEAKSGLPENAKKLRELMCSSDAIMIASPEYNGSFSAVLKNAIDWVSRKEWEPEAKYAIRNKKFALMSASIGKSGGMNGLKQLREVLSGIGAIVIAKQVTVPEASVLFDKEDSDRAGLRQELKAEVQELLKQ